MEKGNELATNKGLKIEEESIDVERKLMQGIRMESILSHSKAIWAFRSLN